MPKVLPPLPEDVLVLAAHRHGVVSSSELLRSGIGPAARDRRVKAGILRPLGQGVAVVGGYETDLTGLAAWQLLLPGLVAERRTAAKVWELDGFRDPPLDLVHPVPVRRLGMPKVRIGRLPHQAITEHRGIRVTTPTWTLGELGAASTDDVELAVESALLKRKTTERKLHRVIESRHGPGIDRLRDAILRRRAGAPAAESYAEVRFLQRIVRPLDLEDPDRQVDIEVGWKRPVRADFVFRRRVELDVEIDGSLHTTPERREHDGLRDHLVRQTGRLVVRFTARRIETERSNVRRELLAELATASSEAAG